MKRSKRKWWELSSELVNAIVDCLASYPDFCNLRSACKKWHSFCPLQIYCNNKHVVSSKLPLQIPFKSFYFDYNPPQVPIFLLHRRVCLLQPLDQNSPFSWFASFDWLDSVPTKLRLCHPLTNEPITDLPLNFPKKWCLSDFRVVELGNGQGFKLCSGTKGDEYLVGFERFADDYPTKSKVLVLSDSTSISACFIVELVFHLGGKLRCIPFRGGKWKVFGIDLSDDFMGNCQVHSFDDIVIYRKGICAIDHEGRAYLFDVGNWKVTEFITEPIDVPPSDGRKLLLESFGELYLIHCVGERFRVYKLNDKLRKWEEVSCLGDRILVVNFAECFFVDARLLPGCKGNCILFPEHHFPYYGGPCVDYKFFEGAGKYLRIGVFYLDKNHFELISSYPRLAALIWPPPSWICQDSNPLTSVSKEPIKPRKSSCKVYLKSTPEAEAESSGQFNSKEEMMDDEFHGDPCRQEPKISSTSCNVDSPPQSSSDNPPSVKFQGVDVSSQSVPILRKIWDKHGNIIQGHKVHSNSLLSWAFETLAEVVRVLQCDSGRNLSDPKAEYLESTLLDLQSMNFKLDWLAPFVQSALTAHRTVQRTKEHINLKKELEIAKHKLLAELRNVEEKLVVQDKLVAEGLSASPPLDVKDML